MLDIIYTKKRKNTVFLFSKLYKMVFKIFKSEMPEKMKVPREKVVSLETRTPTNEA